MNITVIVCTYQRCRSLAKALRSVAGSALPSTVDWEVLVVDNNSSDQTRQVIEEISLEYPGRFRCCFEPNQGKSHALNTGIRESCGEILAFLDDDVTVPPTWLRNLTEVLEGDEWVGSGGRILPDRDFTPPPWLSLDGPHQGAPLALFERGVVAGPLHESPFGTDMAFQRKVFGKYGGFRTDLGPQPGSEIRSEDSEFSHRLLDAGEKLYYQPSAVVYHPVLQDRVKKQYFLKWWFDKARADIRVFGIPNDTKWFAFGVPLYLFRRVAVWTLRWMVALNPSQRFDCKLNVWRNLGAVFESYHQAPVTERRSESKALLEPISRPKA